MTTESVLWKVFSAYVQNFPLVVLKFSTVLSAGWLENCRCIIDTVTDLHILKIYISL